MAGEIPFSPHQLLQELGWERHPAQALRLQQALDRWLFVTCTATHFSHDANGMRWKQVAVFRMLSGFCLHFPADPEAPAACWFSWSRDLEALLLTGMPAVLAVVDTWTNPS